MIEQGLQRIKKAAKNYVSMCDIDSRGKKKQPASSKPKAAVERKVPKTKKAVETLLSQWGLEDAAGASNCAKAGICRNLLKLDFDAGLEGVAYEVQCPDCDAAIAVKLRSLLDQPDSPGLDYEDGCQSGGVRCAAEGCGFRGYLTGMCRCLLQSLPSSVRSLPSYLQLHPSLPPTLTPPTLLHLFIHPSIHRSISGKMLTRMCRIPELDSGKFHNHCRACLSFGKCLGDYRDEHCGGCGGHYFAGLSGLPCPRCEPE